MGWCHATRCERVSKSASSCVWKRFASLCSSVSHNVVCCSNRRIRPAVCGPDRPDSQRSGRAHWLFTQWRVHCCTTSKRASNILLLPIPIFTTRGRQMVSCSSVAQPSNIGCVQCSTNISCCGIRTFLTSIPHLPPPAVVCTPTCSPTHPSHTGTSGGIKARVIRVGFCKHCG